MMPLLPDARKVELLRLRYARLQLMRQVNILNGFFLSLFLMSEEIVSDWLFLCNLIDKNLQRAFPHLKFIKISTLQLYVVQNFKFGVKFRSDILLTEVRLNKNNLSTWVFETGIFNFEEFIKSVRAVFECLGMECDFTDCGNF